MSALNQFRLARLSVVIVVLTVCIRCRTAGAGNTQISCIVVPAQPSAAETHAAREVAKYVNTMTGHNLPLVISFETCYSFIGALRNYC